MDTVDISGAIRTYLLGNPAIVALVGDRIGTPKVYMENGEEAPNPKASFRQMGGATGFNRYLFTVESNAPIQAREIAILIRNYLCEEAVSFPDTNIEYIYKDGGLIDTENEETKKPQVIFYINVELYEF